jgi:hypothetical protein
MGIFILELEKQGIDVPVSATVRLQQAQDVFCGIHAL